MKKLPDYLTEMRLEKDRDKNNNVSQRKHKEYNWDKIQKQEYQIQVVLFYLRIKKNIIKIIFYY